MNGRVNGPLSPVSIEGESEWSGIAKYQTLDTDSPYSPNNRRQLVTPPISGGSNGAMNGGGFPRRDNTAASPPSSIARSSNGTNPYNGTTLYNVSDKGRIRKDEQLEAAFGEHYRALRRFLAPSLRDEQGNPRPNKARDKLIRLSSVQFQELSTDVFDELLRRQSSRNNSNAGQGDLGGIPPFLLPRDVFHPKRNQAREKLATLAPSRFRDLATDVFYELERRFPRFLGGTIAGRDSSSSRAPSRMGTPEFRPASRGGLRMRRPSESSSISGYGRSDSRNDSRTGPMNPGLRSPGFPPTDYGRPLAKTFKNNTIVPNKSTMVEDDDDPTGAEDNDEEDAFDLEGVARGGQGEGSETDKKLIEEYKTQVKELENKLELAEEKFRQKDVELSDTLDKERDRTTILDDERKKWSDLRSKLESQLADAQNLNESLQSQLDRLHVSQSNTERELRTQLDELRSGVGSRGIAESNLSLENQDLKNQLREQQLVTEEVRKDTALFLREMKMLSEQSGSHNWEREEQLSKQILRLEEEVKDWRHRYARTKTQLRSLRASSIGLTIQQNAAKSATENGFTQVDGLVKDVHVAKFQISIDELLRVSRGDDPARVVDFMKAVVLSVRNITQDIDESATTDKELGQQQIKLKARVSATANNLITASKNFAAAKGLSPLSLLDAAASHLTTAVVELVRTVKIKPTPAGELEDDDDGVLPAVDTTGFFGPRENNKEIPSTPFLGLRNDRDSNVSSMYSPLNSPRQSGTARPRSSSWAARLQQSRGGPAHGINGMKGANGLNGNNSNLPRAPGMAFGIRTQESDVADLRIYLEDQTAILVQRVQSLISAIRSESGITAITTELNAIATVVEQVVSSTETSMSSSSNSELRSEGQPIIAKLSICKQKLIDAGEKGRKIADMGDDESGGRSEMEWRMWTQALPPIAFDIARETKELVQRVDIIDSRTSGRDENQF